MIVDLTNVQEQEQEKLPYLARTGRITLKVTKVKDGGITKNNNKILKIFFKTEKSELFVEEVIITDEALWKLKVLTKALKMPNIVDTNLMVDRYVVGNFVQENYTKNDGTVGQKIVCKSWEESKLTNTLTEIPVVKKEPDIIYERELPEIDIDDEEIPF